jgi:hypothetical protein
MAVQYVIDENLVRVGRAFAGLRDDMAVVGDPPITNDLPQGVLDPDWIPLVGRRAWIMITDDRGLRTRPNEAALALEYELKVIHLYGIGHARPWVQAVHLLSRWRSVEAFVGEHPVGPWWLSVRHDSVREMRYEPGLQERRLPRNRRS